MEFELYQKDLPDSFDPGSILAIDTETMGLTIHRDRLCLIQMRNEAGQIVMVQIHVGQSEAPNLTNMLSDPKVLKIFHFARADMAMLKFNLGVDVAPVYCTKIASRLCRTNTQSHGLKSLVEDLLGIELSKEKQVSDWGAEELSREQLEYAASDVLYLHSLKEILDQRLERDGRTHLADSCFKFLPTITVMDIEGWKGDIFAH